MEYAKSLVDGSGGDVEFSAEDAGRSDPEFLAEVLQLQLPSDHNSVYW